MKTEFIQGLLDAAIQKRVFAGFPELKKLDGQTERNQKTIIDFVKKAKDQPIFTIMEETEQDPVELKDMVMKSFDKAVAELRENAKKVLDMILPEKEVNNS